MQCRLQTRPSNTTTTTTYYVQRTFIFIYRKFLRMILCHSLANEDAEANRMNEWKRKRTTTKQKRNKKKKKTRGNLIAFRETDCETAEVNAHKIYIYINENDTIYFIFTLAHCTTIPCTYLKTIVRRHSIESLLRLNFAVHNFWYSTHTLNKTWKKKKVKQNEKKCNWPSDLILARALFVETKENLLRVFRRTGAKISIVRGWQ